MILRSLTNLFDDAAADYTVAVRDGVPISYYKFKTDVATVAKKYQNCRAALICEDRYNFLVGFFGLLYGNSSFISSSVNQTSIAHILQQECDLVIDDAIIANITPAHFPLPEIDAARMCIDFFTSGSTGSPKRVTKSLAMFEKEVAILDSVLTQKVGTVFSTVPHYHVYGLTFGLLWPLASGHPFDTVTHIFWENLLGQITPDALIVSSPPHLRRISGVTPIEKNNIPVQILSAAEPLSAKAVDEIVRILGCVPTEIFGSTETGAIASRYSIEANKEWQPLTGIAVEKLEDGRMQVLSPYVGNSWHVTEDLIELADGGFHFLGRADGVVKIEGRRVSMARVEKALCQIDYVREAVVTTLPNHNNYLAAVVVLSDSGKEQLSQLGNFRFGRLLRRELEPYLERIGMPRMWRFVENIPTHGIGKRNVEELCALF
jgi:acyl-coenzyme A synthetase/AMP-(fatty) acid ligase